VCIGCESGGGVHAERAECEFGVLCNREAISQSRWPERGRQRQRTHCESRTTDPSTSSPVYTSEESRSEGEVEETVVVLVLVGKLGRCARRRGRARTRASYFLIPSIMQVQSALSGYAGGR
jgi:hypothetical protein